MSEFSGTAVDAAPVARLNVPPAGALQVFRTQVVMTEIAGFGIGRGVPKLQPVVVQSGAAEFTAGVAVVGPMVHDGPAQLRVKRLIDPLGTGPSGTSELPPPMLRPPQPRSLRTVPVPSLTLPQTPPGGVGMKS